MAVGNRKRGFGGKGKAALRAARGGDTPRASLYDEVTAKIIAQLEAGLFPLGAAVELGGSRAGSSPQRGFGASLFGRQCSHSVGRGH